MMKSAAGKPKRKKLTVRRAVTNAAAILSAIGSASAPFHGAPPAAGATTHDTGINRTIAEMLDRGERWPVKVGSDSGALDIDLNNFKKTSVAELRSLSRPADLPNKQYSGKFEDQIHSTRVGNVENTQYQLPCWILGAKWENSPVSGDDDFHIVVSDSAGDKVNTMVIEIPNPRYVPDSSPFAGLIGQVRQRFKDKVGSLSEKLRWFSPPIQATVYGIGFWDYWHNQTGAAPLAIELHPVLRVEFQP